MAKIRLLIELEYDETIVHGDDAQSKEWFFEQVLGADAGDTDECLIMHSNHIGDEIGRVSVISTMPSNISVTGTRAEEMEE